MALNRWGSATVSETPSRNVITGFTKPFSDTRHERNKEERKKGHSDEEMEDDGISCCKIGMVFSFILLPMPAPLLYTEIGVVKMCDAHSVWNKDNKDLSSLTRASAANRKEVESLRCSRLAPLMALPNII